MQRYRNFVLTSICGCGRGEFGVFRKNDDTMEGSTKKTEEPIVVCRGVHLCLELMNNTSIFATTPYFRSLPTSQRTWIRLRECGKVADYKRMLATVYTGLNARKDLTYPARIF